MTPSGKPRATLSNPRLSKRARPRRSYWGPAPTRSCSPPPPQASNRPAPRASVSLSASCSTPTSGLSPRVLCAGRPTGSTCRLRLAWPPEVLPDVPGHAKRGLQGPARPGWRVRQPGDAMSGRGSRTKNPPSNRLGTRAVASVVQAQPASSSACSNSLVAGTPNARW
jgi:hypothetical protein